MSHQPRECEQHVWGPWTTEEVTNAAGERQYVLQRRCYACPLIQEEPAMLREEQ